MARGTKAQDLNDAVKQGDIQRVTALLDAGVDANTSNEKELSPLEQAAKHGHLDIASVLLTRGADPNIMVSEGYTPLHQAIENDHPDMVKLLIEQGKAELNVVRTTPFATYTTLCVALAKGNMAIVQSLLDAGAQLDLLGNKGPASIVRAIKSENKDITQSLVKLLLEKKANPNGRGQQDETGLHLAAGAASHAIVKMLIEANANINVRDLNMKTPLHDAVRRGDIDIVQTLIEEGAAINPRDNNGRSPLHYAAESGRADLVQALLASGADASLKDHDGRTPLHLVASAKGAKDTILTLLYVGAGFDIKDNEGRTPLHSAAAINNTQAAELFLQRQADINTRDHQGISALQSAALLGFTETTKLLLRSGADPDIVRDAWAGALNNIASRDNAELAQLLLDVGADVNATDKTGLTALQVATIRAKPDMLRFLLDRQAAIDVLDKNGDSLLHLAVIANKQCFTEEQKQPLFDIVNLLLDAGVNPAAQNGLGNTPLHYAVQENSVPLIRRLLERGADPNAVNQKGHTPFSAMTLSEQFMDLQSARTCSEIAEILVHHGAESTAHHVPFIADLYRRAYNKSNEMAPLRRHLLNELVKSGLPVNGNTESSPGSSLLHIMCANDSVTSDDVELLLNAGAKESLNTRDDRGNLPIHEYLRRAKQHTISLGVLREFLDHGAEVNAVGASDDTALDIAQRRELVKHSDLLIDYGACESPAPNQDTASAPLNTSPHA